MAHGLGELSERALWNVDRGQSNSDGWVSGKGACGVPREFLMVMGGVGVR